MPDARDICEPKFQNQNRTFRSLLFLLLLLFSLLSCRHFTGRKKLRHLKSTFLWPPGQKVATFQLDQSNEPDLIVQLAGLQDEAIVLRQIVLSVFDSCLSDRNRHGAGTRVYGDDPMSVGRRT